MSTLNNVNVVRLRSLTRNPDSCVIAKTENLQLNVWPQYFSDIKGGIKDALQRLMGGYEQRLGGILLGYEGVKLLEDKCFIDISIIVNIRAIFYVFSPKVGITIEGVLNYDQNGLVSFLALDRFNIIYNKIRIESMLQQQNKRGELDYLYEIDGELKEGMTCMLKLTNVGLIDFVPELAGYPIRKEKSNGTAVTSGNEGFGHSPSPVKKSKTNKRKVSFAFRVDDSDISEVLPDVNGPLEVTKPKKHKKKTKTSNNESSAAPSSLATKGPLNESVKVKHEIKIEPSDSDFDSFVEPHKKTKKKRKLDEVEDSDDVSLTRMKKKRKIKS